MAASLGFIPCWHCILVKQYCVKNKKNYSSMCSVKHALVRCYARQSTKFQQTDVPLSTIINHKSYNTVCRLRRTSTNTALKCCGTTPSARRPTTKHIFNTSNEQHDQAHHHQVATTGPNVAVRWNRCVVLTRKQPRHIRALVRPSAEDS